MIDTLCTYLLLFLWVEGLSFAMPAVCMLLVAVQQKLRSWPTFKYCTRRCS